MKLFRILQKQSTRDPGGWSNECKINGVVVPKDVYDKESKRRALFTSRENSCDKSHVHTPTESILVLELKEKITQYLPLPSYSR